MGGAYGTDITKGWIFCLFSYDDLPGLAKLRKGGRAYIKGVCRGRHGTDSSVVIDDCSLSDKGGK